MCISAKKCLLFSPVQASAAPRPENSGSDKKDAQITIMSLRREEPLTVLLFLDRNDGFTFYAIFEEESKSLPQKQPQSDLDVVTLICFLSPIQIIVSYSVHDARYVLK
jgi:hypothetical protein